MFYQQRTLSAGRWGFGAFAILLLLLLLVYQFPPFPQRLLPKYPGSIAVGKTSSLSSSSLSSNPPAIPNIVHFVRLIPDSPGPVLLFTFHHFIAIYSALIHLSPEKIYIHTNGDDATVQAAKNSSDYYTRTVANLPRVVFNREIAPQETTAGLKISLLPHQSDFVRTRVLNRLGGIYLDDDAYVLRDLAPLRRTVYQNVLGRQSNGQICNAVILATPGSTLIDVYDTLQDRIFDGSWGAHSTNLLTTLAADFSTKPSEVLLLPQESFFPGSWWEHDLDWTYRIHPDDVGTAAAANPPPRNLTEYLAGFKLDPKPTWRHDWRLSYVLHGWTSGFVNLPQTKKDELMGEYGGITLEYVLSQKSNFATAVYPAVRHALDHQIITLGPHP